VPQYGEKSAIDEAGFVLVKSNQTFLCDLAGPVAEFIFIFTF